MLSITAVSHSCCRLRKRCGCCRVPLCGQEKPSGLLKGGASCCHTESGKGWGHCGDTGMWGRCGDMEASWGQGDVGTPWGQRDIGT